MNTRTKLFALALIAATTAACNTTRGIGQDIEATGEKIEEVAEETSEKMRNDD